MWNKVRTILKDKKSLEIGGPTILFYDNTRLPLYDVLGKIDNINNTAFSNYPNTRDPHSSVFNKIFNFDHSCMDKLEDKYDCIITSHVVEHMANPISFLKSSLNSLNEGGCILTLLPNKPVFWDRVRNDTTIEHLIQDYTNNVGEDDMTHYEENINTDHPWKSSMGLEKFKSECLNNINTRVMHHHCFNPNLSKQMHEYAGYKTLMCEILPEDNLQIVYIGYK